MSVYTGWEKDLLSAARLPDTAPNRDFLDAWHAAAESDCKLNPVDLTDHNSGSSNCKPADIPYRPNAHFQDYSDRIWTRTAFYGQVTSGRYPHLRAALESGNPYNTRQFDLTAVDKIARDLGNWGSHTFANDYIDLMFQGGPPPTLKAPQALRGWSDLQRAINHKMPAALHASEHNRARAWRELQRARRVRL